jgi:hypothetical protein
LVLNDAEFSHVRAHSVISFAFSTPSIHQEVDALDIDMVSETEL